MWFLSSGTGDTTVKGTQFFFVVVVVNSKLGLLFRWKFPQWYSETGWTLYLYSLALGRKGLNSTSNYDTLRVCVDLS